MDDRQARTYSARCNPNPQSNICSTRQRLNALRVTMSALLHDVRLTAASRVVDTTNMFHTEPESRCVDCSFAWHGDVPKHAENCRIGRMLRHAETILAMLGNDLDQTPNERSRAADGSAAGEVQRPQPVALVSEYAEPWFVVAAGVSSDGRCIMDSEERLVCDFTHSTVPADLHAMVARRIVASVNACAGKDDAEMLERTLSVGERLAALPAYGPEYEQWLEEQREWKLAQSPDRAL